MAACCVSPTAAQMASPFDMGDDRAYRCWRAWKLANQPASADDLVVKLGDPRALTAAERGALLARIAVCSVAVYRSPVVAEDVGLTGFPKDGPLTQFTPSTGVSVKGLKA